MEDKIYHSRDEFLYDDEYEEDEKIEIARRVLEAEEILYEREQV